MLTYFFFILVLLITVRRCDDLEGLLLHLMRLIRGFPKHRQALDKIRSLCLYMSLCGYNPRQAKND